MIYILKFIAAFLLPPGLFVLLGIILSVYLWRRQNFGRFAFSLSAVLTLLLYFSSTLLGAKLLGATVGEPLQPAAACCCAGYSCSGRRQRRFRTGWH